MRGTGTRVVAAVVGATVATTSAQAGGFAVREQSASYQGTSFAGSAAGGNLSSLFWNAAASASITSNIEIQSAYSLILGDAELTATGVASPETGGVLVTPLPGTENSGNIADGAVVPASYAAMKLSSMPGMTLAVGINSPFGLTTKPENDQFVGNSIGFTSKLFSANLNPTVAFQVTPTLAIGAGLQVQYTDAKFSFLAPTGKAQFEGDDIGFGATLGAMWTPAPGTRIGIGWRSHVTYDLEGDFSVPALGGGTPTPFSNSASAELTLPDIVTFSFEQAVSPQLKVLGTVEWTNWNTLDVVTIEGGDIPAALEANWGDGWFFSLGGEYAYNPALLLRAGIAYELTPIESPEQRLTGIPDVDRIWASVGATYQYSEMTTIDFGYSHIFGFEDEFDRTSALGDTPQIQGELEPSVDIISVGVRMKLDSFSQLLP